MIGAYLYWWIKYGRRQLAAALVLQALHEWYFGDRDVARTFIRKARDVHDMHPSLGEALQRATQP